MVTTIGLVGHVAGLIGQHHWNTQITLIGSNRCKQVNVLKDVTGCNGSKGHSGTTWQVLIPEPLAQRI
jgi:hypothetical protein